MGCLAGIAVISGMTELLEGSLAAGGSDVCKLADCWVLAAPCILVTVCPCLQHSKIGTFVASGLLTVSPASSELLLLPTSVRRCWSALAPVRPQSAALHLVLAALAWQQSAVHPQFTGDGHACTDGAMFAPWQALQAPALPKYC